MDYTWITEPPVEVIKDPGQIQIICNQFIVEARRFERLATDEEAVWKDRKRRAERVAEEIRKDAAHGGVRKSSFFCAYKPQGEVVGLMVWSSSIRRIGFVRRFAMLPGREREGVILVEYAVNLSEKAKYEGRTHFRGFTRWHDKWSWCQYLQSEDVVPRESDEEWVKFGGRWRLQKLLPPLPHWSHVFIGREVTGKVGPLPRLPGQPKF